MQSSAASRRIMKGLYDLWASLLMMTFSMRSIHTHLPDI